jgi:hypothetical protein
MDRVGISATGLAIQPHVESWTITVLSRCAAIINWKTSAGIRITLKNQDLLSRLSLVISTQNKTPIGAMNTHGAREMCCQIWAASSVLLDRSIASASCSIPKRNINRENSRLTRFAGRKNVLYRNSTKFTKAGTIKYDTPLHMG